LFGTNALYSFNYERVIINGQKFKTSGQLGFTYLTPEWNADYLVCGILSELISFNKHHIEIGLGYGIAYDGTPTIDTESSSFDYFTGRLGYRYQKPSGRFVFKLGFTPHVILQDDNSIDYGPWGGILFGYNFGR
jgi:hypothetical protein